MTTGERPRAKRQRVSGLTVLRSSRLVKLKERFAVIGINDAGGAEILSMYVVDWAYDSVDVYTRPHWNLFGPGAARQYAPLASFLECGVR